MRIAVVSNFVIRQKHIDQVLNNWNQDDVVSLEFYRIYGSICELPIKIEQQYDLLFIWLCFHEMFPEYLKFFLGENEEKQILISDCVSQVTDLCTKGIRVGRNVILSTLEDWENPIWRITNPAHVSLEFFNEINKCLAHDIRRSFPQIQILDSDYVVGLTGVANIKAGIDNQRWGIPYSDLYIDCMFEEMQRIYQLSQKEQIKCMVLDCDNVLWGGILSEIGKEHIVLGNVGKGKLYADFQYFLKLLYHAGYILAVCSKNDENEVLHIFDEHSGMILRRENIAVFEVNWENKVDSIKRIIKFLNIGMESVLFIDDSESEIGIVKSMLPEVRTVLFKLQSIYDDLSFLHVDMKVDQKTVEDRMASFRSKKNREEIKERLVNGDDIKKELKMEISFSQPSELEVTRIAELTRKTNKFNYGYRYSQSELYGLWEKKEITLYSIYVKDRFCNHGLVGAVGFAIDSKVMICCLSCRVLGYGIEKEVVRFLQQNGGGEDDIKRILEDVR